MMQFVGIHHGTDRDHEAVDDVQDEHADHSPAGVEADRPRLAVDLGEADADAQRVAPAEQAGQEPGNPHTAQQRTGDRQRLSAAVAVEHHVRRQHGEQRVQVTAFRGGEEPPAHLVALLP
jgi:hypothetical protein